MNCVLIEDAADICVVTLNRPQTKNAWNTELVSALHAAWVHFAQSDARVCVLRSSIDAFSAGIDFKDPAREALSAMPNLSVPCNKPIIAAVEGLSLGVGCSLLLMTDIVIASSAASFAYPEARVGLFQGLMGGFPGRLAYKPGLQWLLTGDRMPAHRACEIGMVNEVVEAGHAFERAMEIAKQIARNAPLVTQAMKAVAMQTLPRGPLEMNYPIHALLSRVADSADSQEGLNALREKREPYFTGT